MVVVSENYCAGVRYTWNINSTRTTNTNSDGPTGDINLTRSGTLQSRTGRRVMMVTGVSMDKVTPEEEESVPESVELCWFNKWTEDRTRQERRA